MFKNKIFAGPAGRAKPLTQDIVLTSPVKPGTVISLESGAVVNSTIGVGSYGLGVVKEESVTGALYAQAQGVAGTDVTYPIGASVECYELEAGLYFNVLTADTVSVVKNERYAIVNGLANDTVAGAEAFVLVADEDSAAGAVRLVRFRAVAA